MLLQPEGFAAFETARVHIEKILHTNEVVDLEKFNSEASRAWKRYQSEYDISLQTWREDASARYARAIKTANERHIKAIEHAAATCERAKVSKFANLYIAEGEQQEKAP